MAENFQTVAQVNEVEEGRGLPVEVDGRPIAVFLSNGEYYAIDDSCPHNGAPLCDGLVTGKELTCSWHGWMFNLETGKRLDSGRGKVGTYPVRVVDGVIQVGLA